jgi:hypothetical protein
MLSDLRIPERTIEVPNGGYFAVRGLSYEDMTILVDRYFAELSEMFDRFAGQAKFGEDEMVGMMTTVLIKQTPAIASDVIALGANEPEMAGIARQLPFPTQIEAVKAIAELTFDAGGGPKKVGETVIEIVKGMRNLLPA